MNEMDTPAWDHLWALMPYFYIIILGGASLLMVLGVVVLFGEVF